MTLSKRLMNKVYGRRGKSTKKNMEQLEASFKSSSKAQRIMKQMEELARSRGL